ncbi:MAG: hypothetical protein M1550_05155 [Deltaproteobacteria bacterium]|nr:hypothetical protein [Deltaproteobacteria bacterium]
MEMIRNTYLRKVEAVLKRLDDEIDTLSHKSEKASAEAKEIYNEQIEILRAKAGAARAKLREVREAGAGSWGEFKKGAEFAIDDLRKAIDNAIARVKKTGSDNR